MDMLHSSRLSGHAEQLASYSNNIFHVFKINLEHIFESGSVLKFFPSYGLLYTCQLANIINWTEKTYSEYINKTYRNLQ